MYTLVGCRGCVNLHRLFRSGFIEKVTLYKTLNDIKERILTMSYGKEEVERTRHNY